MINSKMLVVVGVVFLVAVALMGTAVQKRWSQVSQVVALTQPLAP